METKFTKGKWEAETTPFYNADGDCRIAVKSNAPLGWRQTPAIAYGCTVNETKANAALIAAAPEMFELLTKVLVSGLLPEYAHRQVSDLLLKVTTL